MKVTVNGSSVDLREGAHLPELVQEVAEGSKGIAVAVDGAVVPKSEWESVMLKEGMRVEIVRAVQGG